MISHDMEPGGWNPIFSPYTVMQTGHSMYIFFCELRTKKSRQEASIRFLAPEQDSIGIDKKI
jgi:hypothetical protein